MNADPIQDTKMYILQTCLRESAVNFFPYSRTGPSITIFKTIRKYMSLCFTHLNEGMQNWHKLCGWEGGGGGGGRRRVEDLWGWPCTRHENVKLCSLFNPFTPKSDQSPISPVASPEILHHTVWRTWLFIAYSDERLLHYQFSLPHPYISLEEGWENVLFELGSERVKTWGTQKCVLSGGTSLYTVGNKWEYLPPRVRT